MDELNYKEGYTYMVSEVSKLLDKSTDTDLNANYIILHLQLLLMNTEQITLGAE